MHEIAAGVGSELRVRPGIWDLPLPDLRPARRDRCTLRITPSHGDFFELTDRVTGVLAGRVADLVGLPASKSVLVDFRRSRPEVPLLCDSILEACGGAAVSLERGHPEEHASVDSRRPAVVRDLEDAVVAACGGQARCWQADYL